MPTPEADKATITTFAGTPLVRVVDGGLSRNISPANLAADQLDSRYGIFRLPLMPGQATTYTNTPSRTAATIAIDRWQFDDTIVEAIAFGAILAPVTGEMAVTMLWLPESATPSGNILRNLSRSIRTPGAGAFPSSTVSQATVAVGSTQYGVIADPVFSGVAVTGGQAIRLWLSRGASDASDTATGDVSYIGGYVEFTY